MKKSALFFLCFSSILICNAQKSFGLVPDQNNAKEIGFLFLDGPAYKAGLLTGDQLQKVNNLEITGTTVGEVVTFLKNQPDQSVFIIKRGGLLKTISVVKDDATKFVNKCVSGDCINGRGKYNGTDWSYEGEFKGGRKNGKGTCRWASSGDVYTGDYVNDVREGNGKLLQTRGYLYEGGFSNDAYHGKGKLTYPNGDVYSGNFNKDLPQGPGKMEHKNGDVYEGGFDNYQKNGKGKMIMKSGDVYEGGYTNDQQTGKGKMVYRNGNVYEGDFINGNAQGNGILLFSGNKAEGLFENGRIVRGKLTTVSGVVADGEFGSNGVFKNGTVYYTNGTTATGEFNGENNPIAGKVTYKKSGASSATSAPLIKTDDNFCTEIKTLITHSYNNFKNIKGAVSQRSEKVFSAAYTLSDAKTTNIVVLDKYTSIEILLCKNISRRGDKDMFVFDCKKDYLNILRNCLAAESFTEIKEEAAGNSGYLNTGKDYIFKNKDNVVVRYGTYLDGAYINIRKDN